MQFRPSVPQFSKTLDRVSREMVARGRAVKQRHTTTSSDLGAARRLISGETDRSFAPNDHDEMAAMHTCSLELATLASGGDMSSSSASSTADHVTTAGSTSSAAAPADVDADLGPGPGPPRLPVSVLSGILNSRLWSPSPNTKAWKPRGSSF